MDSTMWNVLISFFTSVIGSGLVSSWLITRLKHDYDKRLEEIKHANRIREQGILVARLFSEWGSRPEDRKDLNMLVWEASILLPDELVKEINKILRYEEGRKTPGEIIIEVRKLLHNKDTVLKAEEITSF